MHGTERSSYLRVRSQPNLTLQPEAAAPNMASQTREEPTAQESQEGAKMNRKKEMVLITIVPQDEELSQGSRMRRATMTLQKIPECEARKEESADSDVKEDQVSGRPEVGGEE